MNLNQITKKTKLAEDIYNYKIYNPEIVSAYKPGQFVILRIHEQGERIPLTIAGIEQDGIFDIIFKVVGKTTKLLSELSAGNIILDIAGPMGNPTEIHEYGNCVMIGGGVGIATLFPVLERFAKKNRIISVLGAKTSDLLILTEKIKKVSSEVVLATEDGSSGIKGFVTDALREILKKEKIDFVYAVGPVLMMKAVSEITKEAKIKTIVSLNSIMLDGMGMCGGCRCYVKGDNKFACIDGPEFDAHEVDFEGLERRLAMFREKEKIALKHFF